MNENINLCEILKDCPKGTRFCSYIHGEVEFIKVEPNSRCPIWAMAFPKVRNLFTPVTFTKEGYANEYYNNEKCILVPSFEQPDWSKWQCPKSGKPKFDPKTLKPFDKVLVRKRDLTLWSVDLFSFIGEKNFKCVGGYYNRCIPYNEDTKYLIGTEGIAPEFYRYWEN